LRWRDAPKEYGPHKTLYNRFIRWSRMGAAASLFKKGLILAASGARRAA
jgi:transposase